MAHDVEYRIVFALRKLSKSESVSGVNFMRRARRSSTNVEIFTIIDIGGQISDQEIASVTDEVVNWMNDGEADGQRKVEIILNRNFVQQIGFTSALSYGAGAYGILDWTRVQLSLKNHGIDARVSWNRPKLVRIREIEASSRDWPVRHLCL